MPGARYTQRAFGQGPPRASTPSVFAETEGDGIDTLETRYLDFGFRLARIQSIANTTASRMDAIDPGFAIIEAADQVRSLVEKIDDEGRHGT